MTARPAPREPDGPRRPDAAADRRATVPAWPLFASLALLWAAIGGIAWASLRRTDGILVYTLDDAYIHMAIAKHFAAHGVWGVTPYAFSSSSSSLLWTGVLALVFRVVGPNALVPLGLNVAFASLTVMAMDAGLRHRLGAGARFVTLLVAMTLSRLPVVALTGMEHTLQMALDTALAFVATRWLTTGRQPLRAAPPPTLFALAALAPLARFEGLFLVFVVAVAAAWRRRPGDGAMLAACAMVPLGLYGAVSVAHGWLPLPNSVLIKGAADGLSALATKLPRNLVKARALALPLAAAVAALVYDLARRHPGWTAARILLGIFVGVSLLHLQLAAVGWFYRYEAYLIALGVIALGVWLLPGRPDADGLTGGVTGPAALAARVAAVAMVVAIGWRTQIAYRQSPIASQNIYQQQYQMGRFLARAYSGRVVAANDIGAINFLADLRCLDLMGLASMPIARLHLFERNTNAETVDRVVREGGARIAVVYESWFGNDYVTHDRLPPRWGSAVARWSIPDNVACGGDTVSFFALAAGERDSLRLRLAEFSPTLPRAIRVSE